jgi:hypothetical protein
VRNFLKLVLTIFAILALGDIAAQAAGAIAIGRCDRVGYSYDQPSPGAAAARALAECRANGDSSCSVVVRMRRVCGAFAISGRGGCGARGWAYGGSRALAENIALGECRRHGGRGCRIQVWVCDGRP